jgi:hypothetical protein
MLYQIENQRNGNSPNKIRYQKALSNKDTIKKSFIFESYKTSM